MRCCSGVSWSLFFAFSAHPRTQAVLAWARDLMGVPAAAGRPAPARTSIAIAIWARSKGVRLLSGLIMALHSAREGTGCPAAGRTAGGAGVRAGYDSGSGNPWCGAAHLACAGGAERGAGPGPDVVGLGVAAGLA